MVKEARKLRPISMSKAQIKAFATDLRYPLKPYQIDLVHRTVNSSDEVIYYDGARQIFGKTQVQVMSMLIFAINGRRVLYSAHKKDTVRAIMQRLVGLARQLKGTGVIAREALSNGFEEIFFESDGSIHFRVRTDGTGVGLSLDVIIWDEAQLVSRRAVSDMGPALDSSDYPVSIHIGTPPKDAEYNLCPDAPFTVAYLNDDPNFIHHGPQVEYTPDLEYSWDEYGRQIVSWRDPRSLRVRLDNKWKAAVTPAQREDFWRDNASVWKRPEKWVNHEPLLDFDDLKAMFTKAGSLAQRFYVGVGVNPESQLAYVAANDGRQLMIAREIDLGAGDLEPLAQWLRENARKFKVIRIPGNARGRALKDLLVDKGISNAKLRLVGLPELSSSIARFLRMTKAGEWKVYDTMDTRTALGSFWLGFDQKSGSSYVEAASKSDEALVLSLIQASVDENLTLRARELNGTTVEGAGSQSERVTEEDDTTPSIPFTEAQIVTERPKAKAMVW